MYWKYTIEAKDRVKFMYRDRLAAGSVRGWVKNDVYRKAENDEIGFDDIEVSDLELYVNSGGTDVRVNLEDVEERIKFEDRETDIPGLSEEFRFDVMQVDEIDEMIEKQEQNVEDEEDNE